MNKNLGMENSNFDWYSTESVVIRRKLHTKIFKQAEKKRADIDENRTLQKMPTYVLIKWYIYSTIWSGI